MIFFYHNYHHNTHEYVIRFTPIRYIIVTVNLKNWAILLKIQKFMWSTNYNIEWFVDFLCFHFAYNNYGVLIRDSGWPRDWEP